MAVTAPKSYGKFAHIDAVALRISRLDASGTPVKNSATGGYTFCCEGKLTTTPQTESGAAITKTGYCAGKTCNTWETPDRISGYDGELTICNTSDEVQELIGVSVALSASVANGAVAAVQIVGSLYYETGSCSSAVVANGVTLEMWSRPVLCKTQAVGGLANTVTLWRKKAIPWAYNFVPTGAQDAAGDAFPDYVWSFKLRPAGPGWASGGFNEDTFLNNSVNANAPATQDWTFAEYWTETAPPTCPAGKATYTVTPV